MARALFQKGFDRQTISDLLRFIDWLMVLPPILETSFWQDLIAFQEENRMPYLLSLERMAIDRGREEGRDRQAALVLKLLHRKLGDIPSPVTAVIRSLDFSQLEILGDALWDLESWLQVLETLVVNGTPEPVLQQAIWIKLLEACWGELEEGIKQQALGLSIDQVRSLVTLVLEGDSVDALVAWLAR